MFNFFQGVVDFLGMRSRQARVFRDLVTLDPQANNPAIKRVVGMLNYRLLKLVEEIKAYDIVTYEHSLRVCALMSRGFSHPMILLGALLHDCGKLDTPTSILNKTSPLTEMEFEAIKLHPINGTKRVVEAGVFSDVVENCILKHHEVAAFGEHYFGYREVPEYVYALSMADIFDAITSDRPYAKAEPKEKAIKVLSKGFNTERLAFFRDQLL